MSRGPSLGLPGSADSSWEVPEARHNREDLRRTRDSMPSLTMLFALVLPYRFGAQDPETELRVLLARAHEVPEIRADAARRISEYGVEAIPSLERAIASGNEGEARLALLALACLG